MLLASKTNNIRSESLTFETPLRVSALLAESSLGFVDAGATPRSDAFKNTAIKSHLGDEVDLGRNQGGLTLRGGLLDGETVESAIRNKKVVSINCWAGADDSTRTYDAIMVGDWTTCGVIKQRYELVRIQREQREQTQRVEREETADANRISKIVADNPELAALMTPEAMGKLAKLPGAATFSNREFLDAAQAEVRAATSPKKGAGFAIAAKIGLIAGAGLAFVASKIVDEDTATETKREPAEKPPTPGPLPVPEQERKHLVCTDIGYWDSDPQYASRELTQPNANRYQDFISGHPRMNFFVRVSPSIARDGYVRFDGCDDTVLGPELKEAKGDHARKGDFLLTSDKSNAAVGIRSEVRLQTAALTELRLRHPGSFIDLKWYAQTNLDRGRIQSIIDSVAGIGRVDVKHKPMISD